ncbi:MAG: glycosyltransferase, partial [Planctomycetes bacterium]|nr:glycosyltransferase [Planctomycetota bacterium]
FMRPARRIVRELGDRKFRHLLGTHGEPIELPGVYRIEHRPKGRRRLSPAKQL